LRDQRAGDRIHRHPLAERNDRFSEERRPLLKVERRPVPFVIRHSGFVIDSSFWFRHSSFPLLAGRRRNGQM
jgi:hypothetical protein